MSSSMRRTPGLPQRVTFVAAVVAALGAVSVAKATPVFQAAASQERDTLRAGDLRCLTRRAEDCLDQPVPRDEPHGAVCATCHDLWTPGVPATKTRSCTDSGCHSGPAGLSTFHRTVNADVLADCLHCHQAHDFRVPMNGTDCSACHQGGGSKVEWAVAAKSHGLRAPSAFTHRDHISVTCSRCHGTGEGHGTLEVVNLQDCRTCHHESSVSSDCVACHADQDLDGRALMVTRSMDIRIGSLDRPLRLIPFDHANHREEACRQCHTAGSDLRSAEGADCSGCHAQHHLATSDCSICHEAPARGAHDSDSHLGCAGAGCHTAAPEAIRGAPRTRALCLACHTDKEEHKPTRTCADCHRLPAPVER
jgi:hypothetical protein